MISDLPVTTAPTDSLRQEDLFELEPLPRTRSPRDGIETRFDVPFVARLALKEKQIQQNIRPVIAVHKWFARRPGSLFRALLLAEFAELPLKQAYFRPHRLEGLQVADPFMGGGTPLFEANRLGCDVLGWDVNPMAYWIVRQELAHLDVDRYFEAARAIEMELRAEIGSLYRTRCVQCGDSEAPVKYFIWVKTQACSGCGRDVDLFPGYLLATDDRHSRNVLICSECHELNEVEDRKQPGSCSSCHTDLRLEGTAGRGRFTCPHCGTEGTYPEPTPESPPSHRMVALEYHCWSCKPRHRGRFLKGPDPEDLERFQEAERRLAGSQLSVIPDQAIPPGDETARLHRWGYRHYREMFNARQLLGLGRLAKRISEERSERLRNALATNLSDLLRYQNMLCRYDTRALKSLDIFSVHGFPVGLVVCESNLLGIQNPRTGTNVGSGGWSNIVEKFARAKRYCEEPFEIRYKGRNKSVVQMPGEWIGDKRPGETRRIELRCESATEAELEPESLDVVLTDPPYFANVQYAELMDFCYAWLRRLVTGDEAFVARSTHRPGDLTGNQTLGRGLADFTSGLSRIYCRMSWALKPGAPFVFTYHHNELDAYLPVAVALLDANLVVTANFPCPAEMGGSIHIHRTESAIVDTVFVCRKKAGSQARRAAGTPSDLAALVASDIEQLRNGGVPVGRGDARCLTYGHLIRLAVWRLRDLWDPTADWAAKMETVKDPIQEMAGWEEVEPEIDKLAAVDRP